MQGSNHIYFLYDPQAGQFYYVENDVVKKTGQPKILDFSPGGWQDISIQNVRNTTYFGIDRSFTVPLNFYETAGKIVKNVFYLQGTEARLLLIIMEQKLFISSTEYAFYYDEFYKGELDFSKFVHSSETTTANIMEGGFSKMLKDNEGTTYTYPADQSGMPRIYNDGVVLKQKSTFIIYNGNAIGYIGPHTLAMNLVSTESIDSLGSVSQERSQGVNNSAASLWNSGIRFLSPGADSTQLTVEWDFKFTAQLADGIGPVNPTRILFRLEIVSSATASTFVILQEPTTTDPAFLYNHEWHFQGTATVTIPAGARAITYMTANQNASFTYWNYSIDTGTFTADYNFRKEPTFIKGFDLLDIGKRIIGSLTNGEYALQSSLLSKPGFRIAITSVDCIRLLPNPNVKITWKDFWGLVDTNFDCGLYVIDKVVYLELKEDMIDWNDYYDMGVLSDVKITPATDWQPPSVKIGYPNEKYENVNGRQEFNTTQEYKTPISRGTAKDFVGTIRADCYGLEFLRITLDGKPTTDSEYDDNLFAVHLKDATEVISAGPVIPAVFETVYKVDRTLNAYATGLLMPQSVFNLKLSPKQCLFRKENFLKSCLYWLDSKKLSGQRRIRMAK